MFNPWIKAWTRRSNRARTDIERLMARALDEHNVHYKEQVWIGPYCVDFLLPEMDTVVEVDGLFWHKSRGDKDDRKDKYLRSCGYQVYRWKEAAVKTDAGRCVRSMVRGPK